MSKHYFTESGDGTMRVWEQGDSLATDKELTPRDLSKMTREELAPLASEYWAERMGALAKRRGEGSSPFFRTRD